MARSARRRTRARVLAPTLAALALAGCGGSDDSAEPTPTVAVEGDGDYVGRADEICSAFTDEVLAVVPADESATYATEIADLIDGFADGLEELTPPEDLAEAHTQLVGAAREEAAITRDAAEREAAGEDPDAIQAEINASVEEAYDRGTEAARQIGLSPECYEEVA